MTLDEALAHGPANDRRARVTVETECARAGPAPAAPAPLPVHGAQVRPPRRRSRFPPGTARGRRGSSAGSACRPGSCRSAASSCRWTSMAWITCATIDGPVIFAANHQSHMDTPAILLALPARWRYRRGAGDGQGVLQGTLQPGQRSRRAVVHQQPELLPGLPVLQRVPAAAARRPARGRRCATSARSPADGYSVLIFPEGAARRRHRPLHAGHRHDRVEARRAGGPGPPRRTRQGARTRRCGFRSGARSASRFGAPLRLSGDDYPALARRVEEAVRHPCEADSRPALGGPVGGLLSRTARHGAVRRSAPCYA